MSGGAITASVGGTLASAIVALAVVLGRTRERLAVLEEWARLRERDNERPKP